MAGQALQAEKPGQHNVPRHMLDKRRDTVPNKHRKHVRRQYSTKHYYPRHEPGVNFVSTAVVGLELSAGFHD